MPHNKVANFDPVADDSVECQFFTLTESRDASYWEELCQQLNNSIKDLSHDYIWHRDEFKLYVPINQIDKIDTLCCLASTTCFGDNIDDEWFIVYLILELSKQYPELLIQIKDNDGDFLLIEAADYLPSWANPESTENRVFIHKNQIHIVPPDINQSKLQTQEAVKYISASPEKTKASDEIFQSIMLRIGNYPGKIKQSIHRSIALLPIDIATLLALQPKLISPIVNAYCHHDVIDARACKNIKFTDCVTVEVKFTKCLFAMLTHAKLLETKLTKAIDKRCILSQKLTIGYEILMNKQTTDIFSTKAFRKFISKLNASGYFKENIEGSSDYNKLLISAKEFFSVMECPINAQVSNNISKLIEMKEFSQMKKILRHDCTSIKGLIQDNEDWLNINPEQLNDMLNTHYGKKTIFDNNDVLTANNITSELSSFLMQTSDFEGIESNKDETSSPEIEFDSDDFVKSVQKMLNLITGENADADNISDINQEDYESDNSENEQLDQEFKREQDNMQDSNTILRNIMQSMKEEGLSGPSSVLLSNVGIRKTDLLDSDDDE